MIRQVRPLGANRSRDERLHTNVEPLPRHHHGMRVRLRDANARDRLEVDAGALLREGVRWPGASGGEATVDSQNAAP